MSAEKTPMDRARDAVNRLPGATWMNSTSAAYVALDAALDVEEMACALYISDHPYDTSEQWRNHGSERSKDIYRNLARAIRSALLGADS